jgi:uncharacterized protein YggE
MKNASKYALAILAIGAMALGAWGCGTAAAADGTPGSVYVVGQNTGISVSGVGKVTLTPDLAVLSAGIQVEAPTVAAAQQEAAQAMTEVLDTLKANGIAEKDIATSGYSIYPQYYYGNDKQPTITGYSVSNTVTIKIRKVADAGKLIDAVAAAGGNNIRINNIYFTVDQPERYNEEARELAMADALKRAQQLARLGGVTLGKPAFISESGGYSPQPPIYYDSAARGAIPEVVTPITPGETELQLTVQVIYNIQ